MARSRQDVISEMVDSGLFSDDEIRQAVKTAAPAPAGPAPWKTALSQTAQTALPVLGAAGGAALSSPATFTGAPVVAGAAGFAFGKGLANRLDEAMGLAERPTAGQAFKQTGQDLQMGAVGEILPIPLMRAGRAAVNAIKRNPAAVGSAVDAMGGLPTGTGRVGIENPEATKPGFYNFSRVKDFAGRLADDLARYEEKVKRGWTGTRESIDRSFGGAGKADRQPILRAIQEAKDAAGVRGPSISVQPGMQPLNQAADPFNVGRAGVELDPLGVPIQKGSAPQIPSIPGRVSLDPSQGLEVEGEAIRAIESKLNSIVESAPYGGTQPKANLNLKDLTDLRQRADFYINWERNGGPTISKDGQRILKGLRGQIDSMISGTPEYAPFKAQDEAFSKATGIADQAKSTFRVGSKPFGEMSNQEQVAVENAIKNTLKKGGAEREAISNLEENLGGGYLNEAEMLAAAGGATPERRLPFERVLRPGMGYALLGGAGAAGASALFNPMAALSSLTGLGLAAAATSPRVIGSAIRNLPKIPGQVAPIPPVLARAIAAALAKRKETSNAQ